MANAHVASVIKSIRQCRDEEARDVDGENEDDDEAEADEPVRPSCSSAGCSSVTRKFIMILD